MNPSPAPDNLQAPAEIVQVPTSSEVLAQIIEAYKQNCGDPQKFTQIMDVIVQDGMWALSMEVR